MAITSNVPTSFVPHISAPPPPKRAMHFDLTGALAFVAILFFIVALVTTGGLLVYEHYLKGQLAHKQSELKVIRQSMSQTTVTQLFHASTQLSTVKTLLNHHTTPSRLFNLLEAKTVKNVQLTSLALTAEKNNTAKISIKGIARDFSALIVESRTLTQDSNLSDVTFSNIAPDNKQKADIDFKVSAIVDGAIVENFSAVVASGAAAATTTSSQTSYSATSSTTP